MLGGYSEPQNGDCAVEIVLIVVGITLDVSLNFFSAWLYDEMKQRGAEKLKIKDKEAIDEVTLRRIISEEFDKRQTGYIAPKDHEDK